MFWELPGFEPALPMNWGTAAAIATAPWITDSELRLEEDTLAMGETWLTVASATLKADDD